MTLRLGLLVCDHVDDRFRGVAGDYPDMFRRMLAGADVEITDFDLVAGKPPPSADVCDAWMTTGSRHGVNDDTEWIGALAGFVREVADSGRPYVGVCFGHQMLARALGGEVRRAPAGWGVGVKQVEVIDPPDWLPVKSYRILNSHADQVSRLPDGAVVRGRNDHCPVSLITIGERLMGIQGHPEFTPAYAGALLEARRGRTIPADVADAGVESLATPPDTQPVVDGIVRFIGAAS